MKMFINYSLSSKNIIILIYSYDIVFFIINEIFNIVNILLWYCFFSWFKTNFEGFFYLFKCLRAIKQLRKIKYLGGSLTDDRKCDTGIRILIVKEKDGVQKLKRELKNRKILFEIN